MKKIKDWKKFENTQNEGEFDYDYVKQCFIDLIESNKVKYIDDDFFVIEYKNIPFIYNSVSYSREGIPLFNIDSYIKDLEKHKEIMLELKTGLDKVLDEYPEYKYTISYDDGLEFVVDKEPLIKLSIWNKN